MVFLHEEITLVVRKPFLGAFRGNNKGEIKLTIVVCPKCEFRFDTSYGRITACGGCPSASMGNCGFAKCPRCQHEFSLSGESPDLPDYVRRVA